MKFTKKLLSLLLAIAMLFTITAGIDLSAYAAGWADYAQNINFDTIYEESCDYTDYHNENYYYDAYKFTVHQKGKVTISIECEDWDYKWNTYYIFKTNEMLDEVCCLNNNIAENYNSGRGIYYGSKSINLPEGSYYLCVEYVWSPNHYSGTHNIKLSYEPSIATPTLKATVNANGSFKLSWNKVAGAEKYELYIKQANGSYKLMKTTTATSFTTAVAAKGKTYSYKVRAVTSKNKNATSNYSKVVSVKRK